jgi:uncharacterized phage protein (TIGR02218 family)
MSFGGREQSNQDGAPIALYKFQWGPKTWAYTSADQVVRRIENNELVEYLPVAISDNGMTQGGSTQNDFTVEGPTNLPLVALFNSSAPSETIWLTVRRTHEGEDEAQVFWIGTVSNVQVMDLASSTIICQPITSSFRRTGLRLSWTRGCPHFLYDFNCRVNKDDYRTQATVAGLTGNSASLVIDVERPPGWFDGGFAEWTANAEGTLERRMIEKVENNVALFFGLADYLVVGQVISLYPGCPRTTEACEGKFNNLDNYGGFKQMPGKSPFDGGVF